jgi:hypothetical protein
MRKLMNNLKNVTMNKVGSVALKLTCHLVISTMIIIIEPGLAI